MRTSCPRIGDAIWSLRDYGSARGVVMPTHSDVTVHQQDCVLLWDHP